MRGREKTERLTQYSATRSNELVPGERPGRDLRLSQEMRTLYFTPLKPPLLLGSFSFSSSVILGPLARVNFRFDSSGEDENSKDDVFTD